MEAYDCIPQKFTGVQGLEAGKVVWSPENF